jgi:single-strand DNA-binding protein
MNLNFIQLIGRITRDPEIKALPNGTSVARFGLATNNVFKSKSGEKKESTQFHTCVAFGQVVDKVIGPYVKKGQEIYISGRVEYRQWENKSGGKSYATEIMVEKIQLGQHAKGKDEAPKQTVEQDIPDPGEDEINPEDLPF